METKNFHKRIAPFNYKSFEGMEKVYKFPIVEDYPLDAELVKAEISQNDFQTESIVVETEKDFTNH